MCNGDWSDRVGIDALVFVRYARVVGVLQNFVDFLLRFGLREVNGAVLISYLNRQVWQPRPHIVLDWSLSHG